MGTSLLTIIAGMGPRAALRTARLHLKQVHAASDPWYSFDEPQPDDCVIVGGCGRSGTTLVRELLDRHPRLACGPETAFLCDLANPERVAVEWSRDPGPIRRLAAASPDVVAFTAAFLREHAAAEGKARWCDKTPRNVRNIPRILHAFPNARFIHVVRDGRDVACSLRRHPKETVRHGRVVPNTVDRPPAEGAKRWVADTSLGLAFKDHPRCFELRYERLVTEPEATLRELCAFIVEDFDPVMLDPSKAPADDPRFLNNPNAAEPISARSVGRWKKDLSPDERAGVERVAGELLIATGYAADAGWVADPG
jgi:protein-tyrosine sulfotransferase